ncbi:MAG: NAD(P)-binding domain-containing protein [Halomonas sp.]|uniref:NAD(P)-binding domain-containing protein n=1 Tax=Halomonas sp. TaxID=1486246 RepID=UPI003970A74B
MTQLRPDFIGTGLMGDPMTRRLLGAGVDVTVWNRTAAGAAPLREAGARVAGTIGALVSSVDVVMLRLANNEVVEAYRPVGEQGEP